MAPGEEGPGRLSAATVTRGTARDSPTTQPDPTATEPGTFPYFCFPHFGFGMVHLSTKFTRDMLPYWYKRMYAGDPGTFRRGRAGDSLVYKHHDVFILGHLEKDTYEPVLNISVMPWSTKNLAPSVWHQLYLQTVREKEAQPYSGKAGEMALAASASLRTMILCSLALGEIINFVV